MVYFIMFSTLREPITCTVSLKQFSSACQNHLFQWCRKVVKSGEAIFQITFY